MSSNLTSSNVKKVKELLSITDKNEPGSSAWENAEGKLRDLLYSFWTAEVSKSARLKYYSSGICNLLPSIITAPPGRHRDNVLRAAWAVVNCAMVAPDVNDHDNLETITKGVEIGFIELAVKELRYRPLRSEGDLMSSACTSLVSPASYPNFVNQVVAAGAPLACLEFIREGADIEDDTFNRIVRAVVGTLNHIARYSIDSVKVLPHIVDAVKPYLPLLTREGNSDILLLGFSSARLLIRVFGKDESSKVILENPVILEFYPKLMRKIMEIGVAGNYNLYNTYWILSGIALDLSLISMSDTNKQLLVPIVPLMLEMMAVHHNGDHDVLRYGVVFLSQVSFDESCLAQLQKDKPRIKVIQGIILSDKEQDKETLSLLGVVMNAVFQSPITTTAIPPTTTTTTTTTTTSKRRSSAFKRATSLVFGSSTTTTPQIQVMISYHQKSTGQHAQALVQLFKKRNYKVWIDYESMKGDVQEAMAEAVQTSDIIVVLVSMQYKESANCRMECQYAMKQNKPLLFLVCEDSYKSPTGWLGLIMGQRMWVGVFTPSMVESKGDEVIRRLDETLKGENGEDESDNNSNNTPNNNTSNNNNASSVSTTTNTHHHTMGEIVANLMKEVAILKEKVGEIDGLKAEIVMLKNEISNMKGNTGS
jgi:hypothetical protein